ncbi:diaminopimelate epimerase [Sphingomonas quercus]|uniref:Diaminopimelate epimerase n=1 Tax=Sphingomonas quercus TaxID=2842451 RepID=A0ABS6BKJ5_9SPHN|nr:diaminopimelate epimerase [Sphingomonas quercus]MBU3078372.1 diaminopimelate epimerase [Sphingomonas quercus]
MNRRFHKMHGLGNDFVVVDAREDGFAFDAAGARAVADRRTGVGCDQLIVVGPATGADVSMRIWNADGSEVEACGNATRCVAALVGRDCTIDTPGGLLRATLTGEGVAVDMGAPRFGWNEIPLAYAMDTAAMPVGWGPLETPFAVNVGNPHVVFFVDDVEAVPLDELGRGIETDPLFPERINVNIAQVIDRRTIRSRTWERGVGLTRACGTGACAVAVAAIARRLADGPVTIHLPGGPLAIDWTPGGSILMTGPATHVFTGELDAELLRA